MPLTKPNPYAPVVTPKDPASEVEDPGPVPKLHTTPMSENLSATLMTSAQGPRSVFAERIIITPALNSQKPHSHLQEDLIAGSANQVSNLRASLSEDVDTRPQHQKAHSLRSQFYEDIIVGPTLAVNSSFGFLEHTISRPAPLIHNSHFNFNSPFPDDSTPSLTPNWSSSGTSYVEKVHRLEHNEISSKVRMDKLSKLVSQVDEKPSFSDPDGVMLKRSKKFMTFVKILVMGTLLGFKYAIFHVLSKELI